MTNHIENERVFIGCMLRSPESYFALCEQVRPDMLLVQAHRDIYAAIGSALERGGRASLQSLLTDLPAEYPEQGGPTLAILATLRANAEDAGSAVDYAEPLIEAHRRRHLAAIADRAAKLVREAGKTSDDVIAEIEAGLADVAKTTIAKESKWLSEAVRTSLDRTAENFRVKGETQVGIRTGIAELDKAIGPVMGGDMITISAASGHGKTTLGVQILCHAASSGKPAYLASMEMSAVQVGRRILSSWTGVPTRKQRAGDIDVFEYDRLADAAQRASSIRVLIDDSGRHTTSRICSKIKAAHRQYGLCCAAIDHSLLIRPESGKWQKIETIEYSAMEFKELAKELDIPIILLAQLTRSSQDKAVSWRFTDQALYGGDAIKQASDVLMGVALPRKWLKQRRPEQGSKDYDSWALKMEQWRDKAEIGILKMRDDDDGDWFDLPFDGAKYTFGRTANGGDDEPF